MSANQALFIASQVVPSMAWGGTGVGKSSIWQAMAEALGRTFVPLLGATHLPEDFSGYPTPDHKAKVVRMMPTTWVSETFDGNALVFVDEATNVPAATQAGLLSVITERRVGDYVMPDTTLIVAAANPPHLCPNAVPLSAAMRSRFYHAEWEVDYDHWFEGLRNGCQWTAPPFPVVPDDWSDNLPQYGSLVEAFLRAAPDCREKLPLYDEELSFPNLRTWTYLVRCFAAAAAAGFTDKQPVFKTLAFGCVGQAVGGQFLQYMHNLDLPDPESFLSGKSKYEYVRRPDVNICVLGSLVRALRADCNPDRWLAASEVFITVGQQEIESMLMHFRPFWKPQKDGGVRPNGWSPPADVMSRLMSLVQQ